MLDPDDIDAPDIFGDLGRDAMKVVGPLALLLFAPVLLLIAAFGGLSGALSHGGRQVVRPGGLQLRG